MLTQYNKDTEIKRNDNIMLTVFQCALDKCKAHTVVLYELKVCAGNVRLQTT
jgi:hypothetical protein